MNDTSSTNLNTPMVQFFEFRRQPFPQIVDSGDVYLLPHIKQVAERCEFAFQTGQFYAVIGAVGCGKSSALRYACARLEKRHAKVLNITGGIWSFTELMRQILASLDYDFRQYQPATMVRLAQEKLLALQADGRRCILMIDEAHLLRNDVFAQIHILAQHPSSSSPLFSLMLCGQEELAERLEHPNARPLLSRIADGYFVPPIERDDFEGYIEHHLRLAGAKTRIFWPGCGGRGHRTQRRSRSSPCLTTPRREGRRWCDETVIRIERPLLQQELRTDVHGLQGQLDTRRRQTLRFRVHRHRFDGKRQGRGQPCRRHTLRRHG